MKQQLIVTLYDNGTEGKKVEVTGPLGDKFLCYAMLEGAKDCIRDFKPNIIERANVLPLEMKGNGHAT
jgi:hypothetical protein